MKEQKRSRTLSLTDREWGLITRLADLSGRTRTRQIIELCDRELKEKFPEEAAREDAETNISA